MNPLLLFVLLQNPFYSPNKLLIAITDCNPHTLSSILFPHRHISIYALLYSMQLPSKIFLFLTFFAKNFQILNNGFCFPWLTSPIRTPIIAFVAISHLVQ